MWLKILPWLIGALLGIGIPIVEKGITVGVFLSVVGAIQSLAGNLIDWGIALQGTLLDPGAIPVVQTIWTTFRDFINIFFILILLVIAFATIFNIKDYKASDLLPKLIIVALLINFSMVIAVWVIKLLYIPAQVFLNPLIQGGTVSEKLAGALRVQELFSPLLNEVLLIPEFVTETGLRLALFVIKAFLTAWVALIIWARIIILLGLMIVSPIAWLGYAFPHIRERSWEAWWKQLLTWSAITIPLFGLIYFMVLFSQRMSEQFIQAAPGFEGLVISSLGLAAQQFILGLIIMGLFAGGLMYIRSLSGSLFDWTRLSFMTLWGWSGAGTKWATRSLGVTGAAKGIRERIAEEGTILGTRAREAREARIADRLAGLAGLGPTYAAQRNLLDQSEKATRDIDNRLKQARTKGDLDKIIADLKTTAGKGKKDPETLAAINVLAKRGELDIGLFNQAVNNFKDMPLSISKVMSEWKEGKFGGLTIPEFLRTMRDEDEAGKKLDRLPLEARRMMYNFLATDDAKKIVEKIDSGDYQEGYDIINPRDKRDFAKKVGGTRPELKADYTFNVIRNNPGHPEYESWTKLSDKFREITNRDVQDIEDVVFMGIKDGSVKDFADISSDSWKTEPVKKAIGRALKEREKRSPGSGAKLKIRLERKLIDEGSFDQIRVLDEETIGTGMGKKETEQEKARREFEELFSTL